VRIHRFRRFRLDPVRGGSRLTIFTECDNGPVPWANARRRLLADLARLRHVRPHLDEIRQVDAQCRGDLPDPDADDDPDDYDDEYEVLY